MLLFVAEFRPREHSLKVECRTNTAMDTRAHRILAQESCKKSYSLDSETECASIRDSKQITNYRHVYAFADIKVPLRDVDVVSRLKQLSVVSKG